MRDEPSSTRESALLEKLRCFPRKHFKWAEGKARKSRMKRWKKQQRSGLLRQSRAADNRC